MAHLPRFLFAAQAILSPAQLTAARRLVADSADAAWSNRALPPFSSEDICNEFTDPPLPEGSPPKFSWDWLPAPEGKLTCMDSRTQLQALALFVADLQLQLRFE